MNYYSLNRTSPLANFRQATLRGQAPDKGLYYPESIPAWNNKFITELRKLDKVTIGFEIMKPYVGECLSDADLHDIMKDTLSFDFPLKKINDSIFCLELFHGPTLAFKDLGARFLSRCMGKFSKEQDEKIVVLVATSGDTGGAVADAFYKIEGTEVIILYPSGKVLLLLQAAMKCFAGMPDCWATSPAQILPKFPLGTENTGGVSSFHCATASA